ncbi:AMP-binding protein [Candidatus Dependentiae bacterium]|nr:AMP-binding protein [Candidatus Dependentiae bacterium]
MSFNNHSLIEILNRNRCSNDTWLTIYKGSIAEDYSYKDICSRINDYIHYYDYLNIEKNELVLIILKESIDLFGAFIAGILYGILPAFFAYPSEKQNKSVFLESLNNLFSYNKIHYIVTYSELAVLLETQQLNYNTKIILYEKVKYSHNDCLDNNLNENTGNFLQFTSGTTNHKKGVKLSLKSLMNQINAYEKHLSLNKKSKIISWLPHYHDMGLISCMLLPLIKNIPLIMMSPFDWVKRPQLLFEGITRYKATHLWLPNFALAHLAKSINDSEIKKYDLSSVEFLTCCSEPLSYNTVFNFINKFSETGITADKIYNCYAMAENTFAMTSTSRENLCFTDFQGKKFFIKDLKKIIDVKLFASVGIKLDNIKIKLIDNYNKEINSDGIQGNILIQSDCMLSEYHNNPEETQKSFIDGWFSTGDIGYWLDNELYICGRKKDMIIVAGENIFPEDIETILNEHQGFIPGRNVVFGVFDDNIGTERIIILAETSEKNNVDILKLKKVIFDRLNISVFEFILLPHMTLRKGTAGKISRYLNKQFYLEGKYDEYRHHLLNTSEFNIEENGDFSELKKYILEIIPDINFRNNTKLFTSGIMDSFSFPVLILKLEEIYSIKIPETLLSVDNFDSLEKITETIKLIKNNSSAKLNFDILDNNAEDYSESYKKLCDRLSPPGEVYNLIEKMINNFPLHVSKFYCCMFKLLGIKIGNNVKFLGSVKIKIRGKAENIIIGNNVIIGDNVDFRNRENGKIILKDNVSLDNNVRIVAAREGSVEIGKGSGLGANCVINSGGKVKIGEFTMIAGNVNINSSSHGTDKNSYLMIQPHRHGSVSIGNDVWIGSNASVLINSEVGDGAVISSNSLVSGKVPSFSVFAGVPAKFIRKR